MLKNEKGVTLVALAIITIILLVLAAITLTMVIRGGGVMDEASSQAAMTEAEKQITNAISTANSKFAEEGYPVQSEEASSVELSRAMYVYNDINSDSSVVKGALADGYEIKNANLDGTNINLELSANGVVYKVLYDAAAEKITISK